MVLIILHVVRHMNRALKRLLTMSGEGTWYCQYYLAQWLCLGPRGSLRIARVNRLVTQPCYPVLLSNLCHDGGADSMIIASFYSHMTMRLTFSFSSWDYCILQYTNIYCPAADSSC